jgi:uncharacterized protein YjbI with pentapeptide repeats
MMAHWRWCRALWVLLFPLLPALAAAQSLVFDFQLAPGDQGERQGSADPLTRRVGLQLLISEAPPFCGWSTLIQYDPTQARFVPGSLVPGSFLYGQHPQVSLTPEGWVEVGGIQAEKVLVRGEGELAQLQFEALPGATLPIQLSIHGLRLEALDSSTALPVEALAAFGLPDAPPQEAPPQLLSLVGEAALAQLTGQRSCPGCDLRRQNLAQLDLHQADLRQAQLQEATLLKADLHQADLRGAQLQGAVLLQADLREARLQDTELKDTKLGGAKLQGADFTGAAMDTLDLQGVNLSGVIWVDGRTCAAGSFNRCK